MASNLRPDAVDGSGMNEPVSGYGRNPYNLAMLEQDASDTAQSSAQHAAVAYCKSAQTVLAGYLCDEPTVTSNACRAPTNELDRVVCDDRKLASLQSTIWGAVKDVIKTAFGALVGKLP